MNGNDAVTIQMINLKQFDFISLVMYHHIPPWQSLYSSRNYLSRADLRCRCLRLGATTKALIS